MKPYLRLFSRAVDVTAEIRQRTLQGRHLLCPDPAFNRRVVGLVAKAQQLYRVRIHAFVVMSNQFYLLATFDDAEQMARFCCHLFTNLSKLAGHFHDWPSTVFPERYHHVELARDLQTELRRLKCLLAQGCKENLVGSPLDWPGASSTRALVDGEPLHGEWVDGTGRAKALSRGLDAAEDFTELVEVELSPLPALAHLSAEQYRRIVRGLTREVEEETRARHRVDGTAPLGVAAILARHPHDRPSSMRRSVRPWFFALDPVQRQAMITAVSWCIAQYREAAEQLKQKVKSGDDPRTVQFPAGTFPPGLPFVRVAPPPSPG